MTTLTASQVLLSRPDRRHPQAARSGGPGVLLARMVAAARAGAVRRRLEAMPDHLLRDIGLTRGDIRDIDL